jgi:hypothetical protein
MVEGRVLARGLFYFIVEVDICFFWVLRVEVVVDLKRLF